MQVIGLSYDPVAVLAEFTRRHGIGYPLLSDEGSRVIRELGLENHHIAEHQAYYGKPLAERHKGLPYPGTFLLDERGVVMDRHFEQSYRWRPSAPTLLSAATGGAAAPAATAGAVGPGMRVDAAIETATYRPEEIGRVLVTLHIDPGYHVYVAPTPAGYTPLRVALEPLDGVISDQARLPAGGAVRTPGVDDELYAVRGTVPATVPFRIGADLGDLVLTLVVDYQACDDVTCLPPGRLRVELPLAAQAQVQ